MGRITGTTTYDGVRRRRLRDRGRAREDGDQAGRSSRELDEATPGPRDPRLQHLLALDHRDGRGDAAARQGRRLPLLLPGLGDAAGRDRQRRGHLARDGARPPSTSRRRSASSRSPAPRSRASSSTASSTRPPARSGARRRSRGSRSRRSTRPSPRPNVAPMGPFILDRHARPRHRAARRRVPERVLRRLASTSTRA